MTPKEMLISIVGKEYESENKSKFSSELLQGMNDEEIKTFKKLLPNNHLPVEIEELLRFARGFTFYGLGEIRFDGFQEFGFEEAFPNSIQLASNGSGDFWIVDISNNGEWREVYFVCHNPPVIVKHSKNISEFIHHVDEFGRIGSQSNLYIIIQKTVVDIYEEKSGIMEQNERDYYFPDEFSKRLPEIFMVADLTHEPIRSGFNWAKYGAKNKIIRFEDKPIWILEKKIKQGFLARVFNLKKK